MSKANQRLVINTTKSSLTLLLETQRIIADQLSPSVKRLDRIVITNQGLSEEVLMQLKIGTYCIHDLQSYSVLNWVRLLDLILELNHYFAL